MLLNRVWKNSMNSTCLCFCSGFHHLVKSYQHLKRMLCVGIGYFTLLCRRQCGKFLVIMFGQNPFSLPLVQRISLKWSVLSVKNCCIIITNSGWVKAAYYNSFAQFWEKWIYFLLNLVTLLKDHLSFLENKKTTCSCFLSDFLGSSVIRIGNCGIKTS
jgi:hypothetical protein